MRRTSSMDEKIQKRVLKMLIMPLALHWSWWRRARGVLALTLMLMLQLCGTISCELSSSSPSSAATSSGGSAPVRLVEGLRRLRAGGSPAGMLGRPSAGHHHRHRQQQHHMNAHHQNQLRQHHRARRRQHDLVHHHSFNRDIRDAAAAGDGTRWPGMHGGGLREAESAGGGAAARLLAASSMAQQNWEEAQMASTQSAQQRKRNGPPQQAQAHKTRARVFYPTDKGADPSGGGDSTQELQETVNEAFGVASTHVLMAGVIDMGGAEVHLGGGQYVISKPLTIPDLGGGNVLIHGGTIRASSSFPPNGYLIELASSKLRDEWELLNGRMAEPHAQPLYENIILRNLMLDANYTGGGILLLNPLRVTIENCYITHFSTVGISVQGGHETLIHSTFLGQHITSGGDPEEKNFGGTAILLNGNDNLVTDVVIFSAQTGIEIKGQANMITGAHCYNKATGWGGVGIIVRQGADQTRLLSCYMDYTGIVLEETRQVSVSNSFFLGDASILLRAMPQGTSPSVFGVSIINNMFCGSGKSTPIVQLNGNFSSISQSIVDGNSVKGMAMRSTRARASTTGFGTNWTLDLSQTLLFPNSLGHVQYSFFETTGATSHEMQAYNSTGTSFPQHAMRSATQNVIMVVSNVPVYATVSVYVDQSHYGGGEHNHSSSY